MAEEQGTVKTFKIANVPVSILIRGKKVIGGLINNKVKFDVIREFPLKLKFASFVRDIPKENFLDLYKRVGAEIRLIKGKGKKIAPAAARKSKSKPKRKAATRKRCESQKKK